jgi:hypothetical protein
MLTRKQFFMMTAHYCLDAARTALAPLSGDTADIPPADPPIPDDDLFYEAMRNGIDPATFDIHQMPDFGQDAEEKSIAQQLPAKGGDTG